MRLKEISIQKRFVYLVVIIFIILSVFSLAILSMINQLSAVTHKIYDHPLEVSNAAYEANVDLLKMHRDLKDIILAEEDYEINILVDRIRVLEGNVYVTLDIIGYNILGEEGKRLNNEAKVLFEEWKDIRSEIIELVRTGKREEAIELTQNKGADHVQLLERKLIDLNSYARRKAEDFRIESLVIENNSKIQLAISVSLLFILIVIVTILMSKSILGGIKELSQSMNNVVEGKEFTEGIFYSDNELGSLGRSFNELILSINDQLWVKEGSIHLVNQLVGDRSLEENIKAYVEELNDYMNLLSTCYYHKNGKKLELTASVNRLGFLEKEYELGSYIVGECGLNNKEMTINYDDNLKINPAEGLVYTQVKAIPIDYNDILYGVLVISHKEKAAQKGHDLLELTVKDFGAYIAATEQKDLLNLKTNELEKQNNELKRLRHELVTKYNDLEEISMYKSQFLTNVSHELKTPLNSIIVLSTLLSQKESDKLNEKDHEQIGVINKAGRDLLNTIDNILDISKVESGTVEVYNEIFESEELINQLMLSYEPVIHEKKLKCEFNDYCHIKLKTDKTKIIHIVTNFISNALKFTKEGSIKVKMDFNSNDEYPLLISVEDTGIGIREEKLEIIFEEFVQSDGSISRTYGGTGLGLAICKDYTRLIGGKIDLDSEYGRGSIFSLLLPSSVIQDNKNFVDIVKHISDDHCEDPAVELLSIHQNTKVLICDDESMNVFALSSMLEEIGILPVVSLSGEEAIDECKKSDDIELILMDYMMPYLNGFQTVEKIREIEGYKTTTVCIITAAKLSRKEENYIKEHQLKVIRKPIHSNDLIRLLNHGL